jgi:hypothetical protein
MQSGASSYYTNMFWSSLLKIYTVIILAAMMLSWHRLFKTRLKSVNCYTINPSQTLGGTPWKNVRAIAKASRPVCIPETLEYPSLSLNRDPSEPNTLSHELRCINNRLRTVTFSQTHDRETDSIAAGQYTAACTAVVMQRQRDIPESFVCNGAVNTVPQQRTRVQKWYKKRGTVFSVWSVPGVVSETRFGA